jgi:hypothetical protein
MKKRNLIETYDALASVMAELGVRLITPEQARAQIIEIAESAPKETQLAVPTLEQLHERYLLVPLESESGEEYEESYESSSC